MSALRTARALLVLCSLAAATAAVGSWSAVAGASPATAMAEAWRMIGFATFAALFALLAAAPARSPGLWLVVGGNKLVLSVSAATWLASADGAADALAGVGVALSRRIDHAGLLQRQRIAGSDDGVQFRGREGVLPHREGLQIGIWIMWGPHGQA